jgi:mannose-1-phosphate guanylyltransferase
VLELIPPGRNVSIERETFPLLLSSGIKLYAHTTEDYWIDIGRPEHYCAIHRDVLDGILTLGPLADPSAHRGTFHFSGWSGVPVGITPPTFLGADVTLARGATVGPHAVLGDGVRIGAGAEVSRSILWDNVTIEPGARVDGAVIASGAKVGRGAVIQPGAVIGHQAIIPPEAIVPSDARVTAELTST